MDGVDTGEQVPELWNQVHESVHHYYDNALASVYTDHSGSYEDDIAENKLVEPTSETEKAVYDQTDSASEVESAGKTSLGAEVQSAVKNIEVRPAISQRKLTLIAYWSGDYWPAKNYLETFFASVTRQPDTLELLWINTKGVSKDKCLDISQYIKNATNVQTVCINNADYVKKFANQLCTAEGGWNCNRGERQAVTERISRWKEGPANVNYKVNE